MAGNSTEPTDIVVTLSDEARAEQPARERQQRIESIDNEFAGQEVTVEIPVAHSVAVRETHRLYRLKADRFVAIVAADTEQEARMLAATHDALGGDWRNPQFASVEFENTGEAQVFGDLVISALALPRISSKKP